ncbi:MAG: glycosyltransferase family 2 protein [Lysobacter sp.]|nr:glycosyltransferase family 2 protein [Lysobacter sp.]
MAAIVVSYQSAATIDDCLTRLRAAQGVSAIRVVDNHSSDGTLDIVQRHAAGDARVRFIDNPDNPGFGVGCNQGVDDLGAVPARWLAFVNPDCLLEADALARLRALAAPLGDALLGADLVDDDGVRDGAARRNDPDFAGMLAGALRRAPTAALNLAPDDARALQPVQAVSGALMLMPRALFARIGGFDPGYRLHAEDLDLCRRAREAGATVAVANQVRVLHVRGVSSRSRPLFVEWHKHRGLARYFRKFEAPKTNRIVRAAVYAMIWARFFVIAPQKMLKLYFK